MALQEREDLRSLAFMDQIILNELLVQGIVGVNKKERHKKQNIVINLVMYYDVAKAGASDDVKDTINYSSVAKRITEYTETSHHYTLEALATGIARVVCTEFAVSSVMVRVEKPGILWLAKSPAVQIHRFAHQFATEKTENQHKSNTITSLPALTTEHQVYLALGSNIGDRLSNLHEALKLVSAFARLQCTSLLYQTPPAYVLDQPEFLNIVCKVVTSRSPEELLREVKSIEMKMQRATTVRYGPRNIDVDILLYDNLVFTKEKEDENEPLKPSTTTATTTEQPPFLAIPHPKMKERVFVLKPLCDIAPELVHPVYKKTMLQLLQQLPSGGYQIVFPARKDKLWELGARTYVMAVLNITPDSFSDGGKISGPDQAAEYAAQLVADGADVLDIGGQSTRPGADLVPVDVELERVIPVVKAIRAKLPNTPISVDTFYSEVADAALTHGADIINDVTAGTYDPRMLDVAAKHTAPIILMHTRGDPQTMTKMTDYPDLIGEVSSHLHQRAELAQSKGVFRWNVMVDPGIGFAKNENHNLEIIRQLNTVKIKAGGYPILLGPSRKRFIGTLTGKTDAKDRDWGTSAACCAAIGNGVDLVRIHCVQGQIDAIKVADAIYRPKPSK